MFPPYSWRAQKIEIFEGNFWFSSDTANTFKMSSFNSTLWHTCSFHCPGSCQLWLSLSSYLFFIFFFFCKLCSLAFSSLFDCWLQRQIYLHLVTEIEDIGFASVHRDNVAAYRATRIRKFARVLTALKICNGIAIAVGLHSTSVDDTRYDTAGNGPDWLISLTLISPRERYRRMNTFGRGASLFKTSTRVVPSGTHTVLSAHISPRRLTLHEGNLREIPGK